MIFNISIKENSWIAKLATKKMKAEAVALVIGKTIHIYGVSISEFKADSRWVRHELEHVIQYKKHGIFFFLWLYLYYSAKFGYYKNPFEMEARASENDIALNHKIFWST